MPVYRNNNSHLVEAHGVRIEAGQAKEVDGDAAKVFDGYSENGVEKLSGNEAKEALRTSSPQEPGRVLKAELHEQVQEARAEIDRALVVAPLHTVVGDDEAPFGPPTGTITTKQAVAKEGIAERLAFADHEAVGKVEEGEAGFSTRPNSKTVHNLQAENADAADEAAQRYVEAHEEVQGTRSSDEDEGDSKAEDENKA